MTLPKFNDLLQNSRKPSVVINANNNQRLAVYGELYSNYIEFNSISPHLINAVIAIEDNRFYSHPSKTPVVEVVDYPCRYPEPLLL